jgi:CO dehydrogenase nickel-insertion accessory protein CooC1
MLLDSLLARRLVVLTGKGGVGKSTVGAAIALAARARGKRVLLVEVAAPLEAARRLGAGPRRAAARPSRCRTCSRSTSTRRRRWTSTSATW